MSWKNASVYYKDVLILIRENTSLVEWKLRLVFPIITKLRDTFDIWLTWAEGFSGNISCVPHRHHRCCFRCRHRWPQSQLFIISKNKQIEVIKSPLSYSSKYGRHICHILAHLSWRLMWRFLIKICPLIVCHSCCCCKFFTFSSSSSEPFSQF